jgi:hypothetical protein
MTKAWDTIGLEGPSKRCKVSSTSCGKRLYSGELPFSFHPLWTHYSFYLSFLLVLELCFLGFSLLIVKVMTSAL